MKKSFAICSIILNVLLLITLFQTYNRNEVLENLADNYRSNYLPHEMYAKVRDKVDDYEWILKNIYKVDGIDAMRMHWCKR